MKQTRALSTEAKPAHYFEVYLIKQENVKGKMNEYNHKAIYKRKEGTGGR